MYEFHYKYIKNKFDAKSLFTERDNLVYGIKTEDIYKHFYRDKNLFEFRDYPLDSKLFDPVNKMVIGKMKYKFKGRIISEFVGLKSKMYSIVDVDDEEVKKAKGVNKKIRHKELVDVLFNKKVIRHNMKRIQNKLHRIGTYDVCKISLFCFDDERYIYEDSINSLAYFHKGIKD